MSFATTTTFADYVTLLTSECHRRRLSFEGVPQKQRPGNKWGYKMCFEYRTPRERVFTTSHSYNKLSQAKQACAELALTWVLSSPPALSAVSYLASASIPRTSLSTSAFAYGSAAAAPSQGSNQAPPSPPVITPGVPSQGPEARIPRHLEFDININDLTEEELQHRFEMYCARLAETIEVGNERHSLTGRWQRSLRHLLQRVQNEANVDMEMMVD